MKFFPRQHVLAWESISFKAILATVTVFDEYDIVRFILVMFLRV